MISLRELTEEYMCLREMALDPDTDPQTLADTMEGLDGEIEAKADAYATIMKEMEGSESMLKAEIERLQKNLTCVKANRERMKKNLEYSMIVMGKKKFKTALFSFGISKNPKSCVVDTDLDWDKVPEKYIKKVAPQIDKALVKAALEAGEKIAWAYLEQGESLRIR